MRAVICGAGVAGLTLARLLADAGWQVRLVERAPALRDGGYMIDFFGPGYDVAEHLAVLPRLRRLAYRVGEVSYVDRRGRRVAGLDYERMSAALDGRLLSLMRGDLVHTLHDGLTDRVRDRVQIRFAATVAAVDEADDRVTVTLSDGSRTRADLLVGADGVHSTVRGLVFGPEMGDLRYLGFHTSAWTFAHPDLHARLGGRFAITDTADRAVGLYGIRGGRVAVFTVHRAAEPQLPADPPATVREVYAGLGWLVPEVLDRVPEPSELYYDQVAQVEMPSWSRGHATLVGDACSAVSLLAGQGASLAMAGARVLADELAGSRSVTDAAARYQARFAPVVAGRQAAGRRAAAWFLPGSTARLMLRRVALRAMRLPGLNGLITPLTG